MSRASNTYVPTYAHEEGRDFNPQMPRLLHMADVHLGARHDDLGPAAAAQRERQFAAFRRAIELAIAENVDLVLICGDLFDSNGQPRRSVERAATELARLVDRHIPVVIIPGTHDSYEPSSIYRAFDLAAMSGAPPDSDRVTVLTDSRPRVDFANLDLTVHGVVFATKRAPQSPLAGFPAAQTDKPLAWQVGMIHGSLAVPGKFDLDEVIFTDPEVAASGLDYLALGHWHSFREGRAGATTWAYSGAPEPVALDQDGAGQVLLVELEQRNGKHVVKVEPKPVGRTRFEKIELDAAAIASQGGLEKTLRERADPDRVLDVRVVGVKSDGLDLNVDELERQLQGAFLRLRVRDSSIASLPESPLAPPDTILGAFAREFGTRIVDHESRGDSERAAELREALRLGILLLDDPQRVTLA
ncbi:MAG: metallophosphoesterase family protein [Candidatus Limnocylindrales bacterium]